MKTLLGLAFGLANAFVQFDKKPTVLRNLIWFLISLCGIIVCGVLMEKCEGSTSAVFFFFTFGFLLQIIGFGLRLIANIPNIKVREIICFGPITLVALWYCIGRIYVLFYE